MANVFEQYEQPKVRPQTQYPRKSTTETPSAVPSAIEEDAPIFNRKKIEFKPKDPITHMCICNDFLVLAMSSNLLLRLSLEQQNVRDEVEMPKSVNDKIHNLYVDPTGRHIIISMTSQENYYLSRNAKAPLPLTKLKGYLITAIGWNKQNTSETSTGEILIGTSKGLILDVEISSEGGSFFQATLDRYVKQAFNLGGERHDQVTGIEVEKMTSQSKNEYKYFVLSVLPGRLYQFVGSVPVSAEAPILLDIFSRYNDSPERFLELPGALAYSVLRLYHPEFRRSPESFAWMTGAGVLCGKIDSTGTAGHDSVIADLKLIKYPSEEGEHTVPPISILLTEFHVLILFPDCVKIVCVLNEQKVFEDLYSEMRYGRLINLCRDPMKNSLWAFTSQTVFRYRVIREDRDVCQLYLDAGNFELAKKYCQTVSQMNMVQTTEADALFAAKKFGDAARLYALAQISFENVALKFIGLEDKEPLKIFLREKLKQFKDKDKGEAQITMLVIWLVEIFLNQLGRLKEQGASDSPQYTGLQKNFHEFLKDGAVKKCADSNRNIVYDLIASHGDVTDLIFFAMLVEDYERVINHYIQQEDYQEALHRLERQHNVSLFYKFSPVLMQNIPVNTVNAWIKKGGQLKPRKLIPALVQYDSPKYELQSNEVIRYLEFCVSQLNVTDQSIHNYLMSLYAKLQPEKLMTYLEEQGTEQDKISYDTKYALRLCTEHNHKKACVHIYSMMGLYEEAVDLALQPSPGTNDVDVDLAIEQANKPDSDDQLKKKLWLKIAHHVVEKEKDVKRAMEFLYQCNLLKIEDILPFFPDFVVIDDFKEAICSNLQEYNQHIDTLQREMDDATKNADEIREEIRAFKNRYAFVKSDDKCSCCGFPLMTRTFYLFPCSHRFHRDCLMAEILPNLSREERDEAEALKNQLDAAERSNSSTPVHQLPNFEKSQQNIKSRFDDIIAGECGYCGDIMINCIDKPFIEEGDWDTALQSWFSK